MGPLTLFSKVFISEKLKAFLSPNNKIFKLLLTVSLKTPWKKLDKDVNGKIIQRMKDDSKLVWRCSPLSNDDKDEMMS